MFIRHTSILTLQPKQPCGSPSKVRVSNRAPAGSALVPAGVAGADAVPQDAGGAGHAGGPAGGGGTPGAAPVVARPPGPQHLRGGPPVRPGPQPDRGARARARPQLGLCLPAAGLVVRRPEAAPRRQVDQRPGTPREGHLLLPLRQVLAIVLLLLGACSDVASIGRIGVCFLSGQSIKNHPLAMLEQPKAGCTYRKQ